MPMLPDPATTAEAAAAYQAAKRVLGPTAGYLGQGLQQWTQRQVENVQRIFDRAEARLDDEQKTSGAVPPRVVKGILDEGSFCDDELTASYFGGVLASSKSEVDRDDRGATMTALIGRLSTYQVRAHYLLYAHARARLAGSQFNISLDTDRQEHARVFVPFELWVAGMELSSDELLMFNDVVNDCIQGLLREELIEAPFGSGSSLVLATVGFPDEDGGIATQLTPLGVQLFSWAHGYSRDINQRFLDPATPFEVTESPALGPGAKVLADVRVADVRETGRAAEPPAAAPE